jgi:hypothetical protein
MTSDRTAYGGARLPLMDVGDRGRACVFALASMLAILGALALPALAARGETEPELIPTIAPLGPNETRATIPIGQSLGSQPFVVLSERVRAGGGLRRGDVLRATAEVQLSTTCAKPEPRCIGSRYTYSPRMVGQVVLASSPTATGGSGADPISDIKKRRCNQQRPNRNHHCVLVFSNAVKKVRNAGNLPCPPDDCYLNVVASADHPNAGAGDLVIVGADRPDASVDGDKARVDGLIERGAIPPPRIRDGGAKMRDSVLIEPSGEEGRKVVRSLRLDGLRKGDALRISTDQRIGISSVPYNVYIGTRVIVATSPTETRTDGFVSSVISNGGEVTEQNGYNCTQGGSAYKNPCNSPKAATAYVKRRMPQKNGEPKPVFVNIVMAGLAKLDTAHPNDRMSVLDGEIRTRRYRAP